jgi:hypothetical protein
MGMTLPPEYLRFLRSLNANRVDYLVVGGYAVIHHIYSRPLCLSCDFQLRGGR